MSNAEASKLYETIIEDVISDSRQDFENMGIDEATLQELRKIWCEKLSESKVGKFSWDENDDYGDDDPALLIGNDASANTSANTSAAVKGEPTSTSQLEESANGGNIDSSGQNGDVSGDVGASDVLSYNNDLGIELPPITVKKEGNDDGLSLPPLPQTDGTFEMTLHVNNPKQVLKSLQKKSKTKRTRSNFRQVDGTLDDDDDDDDVDDNDDDDEDGDIFNDSDDINSDLDDDLESDKSDDEDGDQEGQIMLCLYDKVQRIKNKWKANLKEGVANIDGKDYVFHKATGECEW
ncbi:TOA1 [Candida theae]|uniref:Transcription initiation factor IIA large subunit n=1 Tax=Candida theae TaxID=1198502 RepID=A0AAD5FXG1_9ASCO|nr:TOA1 [Candida theae]KAI5953031.1 TOA1 [Candida theae]